MAKAVLETSWLYNPCKHLLFIGTWYTKSGTLFKKQTKFKRKPTKKKNPKKRLVLFAVVVITTEPSKTK